MPPTGEIRKYFKEFLIHLKTKNYSDSTIETYDFRLKYFHTFLKKKKIYFIDKVTPQIIQQYPLHVHELRTKRNNPLSSSLRYALIQLVKQFFSYLHFIGRIQKDPAEKLILPKYIRPSVFKKVLTISEMKDLLSQPNTQTSLGLRDKTILELLYSTGMRVNELLSLNVSDINLTEEIVRVQGKGNKERILPIGTIALNYLKQYLIERKYILTDKKEFALFVSREGSRLTKSSVGYILKKYQKDCEIQKVVNAHTIRHTCATHMLNNGADIRYIQKLLGHSDLRTTSRYTHVLTSDLKELISKYHPRDNLDKI